MTVGPSTPPQSPRGVRGLTQGRQFLLQEGDVIRDNLNNVLQPLMDGFETYEDSSAFAQSLQDVRLFVTEANSNQRFEATFWVDRNEGIVTHYIGNNRYMIAFMVL
jgi:hypothetical protein